MTFCVHWATRYNVVIAAPRDTCTCEPIWVHVSTKMNRVILWALRGLIAGRNLRYAGLGPREAPPSKTEMELPQCNSGLRD